MDTIICNLREPHLLKNPRCLPCGFNVCLKCIQNELYNDEHQYKCKNCDKIHNIYEADKLPISENILKIIENNIELLTRTLLDKLNNEFESLKNTFSNREELIENHFEYLKEEIEIRIESIKIELDSFQQKYNSILDKMKNEMTVKINASFKENELKYPIYETFIGEINQKLEQIEKNNLILMQNIYNCETFIKEINKTECDFHLMLRSVTFNSAKCVADESFVGYLSSHFDSHIDVRALERSKPVLNYLTGNLRFPYSFCKINKHMIAIIDIHNNEIFLLNKDFKIIRKISKIGDEEFDIPLSITADENENVYICDSGHDRLIFTNKYFVSAKSIIGKRGKLDRQFNHPRDISCYNKLLYVLDYYNQCIKVFDLEGIFVHKIRLYSISQDVDPTIVSHQRGEIEDFDIIYDPYHIAVYDDTIAVIDYRARIYIYNFDGKLKKTVEQRYINTMVFADGYLFTHGVDGQLVCYDSVNFVPLFSRYVEELKHESNFMSYFNGNLVIGFNGLIAVI